MQRVQTSKRKRSRHFNFEDEKKKGLIQEMVDERMDCTGAGPESSGANMCTSQTNRYTQKKTTPSLHLISQFRSVAAEFQPETRPHPAEM